MKNVYEQKRADGETVFRVDKTYKGERYVKNHPSLGMAEADLNRVNENWKNGFMADGSPRDSKYSNDGKRSSVKELLEEVRKLMHEHGAISLTITETEHKFAYS